MAFRIQTNEPLQTALRRIAEEQLQGALASLEKAASGDEAAVHDVRKRCKKLRGLLRLCRAGFGPACGEWDRRFRDAGRLLAADRDVAVALAAIDLLKAEVPLPARPPAAMRALREETGNAIRARAREGAVPLGERISACRAILERAARGAKRWKLNGAGDAILVAGLSRTHRRARRCWRKACEDAAPGRLHELRKAAKYHWYHLRLVQNASPAVIKRLRMRARDLGLKLGEIQDLEILDRALSDARPRLPDPALSKRFEAHLCVRKDELRDRCLRHARLLFSEKSAHFAARFVRHWHHAGRRP